MIFVTILSLKIVVLFSKNYLSSNNFLLSNSGHIDSIISTIKKWSDLEIGFWKLTSKVFLMSSKEFPFNARAHNKADVFICFISFLCTITSTPEIILLLLEAKI